MTGTTRRRLTHGSIAICALALVAWLILAVTRAREEARSAQCECMLAQLGHALHNYESAYGCPPLVYVADANGKPL